MSHFARTINTSRSTGSSHSRKSSKTSRHTTKKKHLILDLDDTLICSQPKSTTKLITTPIYFKYNGKQKQYPNVVERPGLDTFLEKMRAHYYLHIFTSSYKEYAEGILSGIGIKKYFSSVWHREHCKMVGSSWVKDINSLPFPIADMILIDDSYVHYDNQPDNTILIKPFTGDENDNEFEKLTRFLIELSKCDDVRPIKPKFDYFSVHRTLPLPVKQSAPKTLSVLRQRMKIEDNEYEESEGDITSFLGNYEGSKEMSLYEESASTETTRLAPTLKTQLKFLRTARPKERTNSKFIGEPEYFGIEEYFGKEDDVEDFKSRRQNNVSHEYDPLMEEKISAFDNVNPVVRNARMNSQYRIFATFRTY